MGGPAARRAGAPVQPLGALDDRYVTIYPGGTLPLASDVNYAPGQTVPNLVVATVSANGTISAYIPWGQADLVGDVFGYYS